jgi:hypothetical protein
MRITKKFAGAACIGKQVFQPCEQTPENASRITEAHEARASAERLFLSRLEHAKCPRKSTLSGLSVLPFEYQTKEMSSLTFLASSESMGMRSQPPFLLHKARDARPGAGDVMSDHAAGGLLLDFFAAVRQRAGDDGNHDEKMSSNDPESSDDGSNTPNDRKRALSMPDLGSPTSVNEPAESMSDDPPMEMKRAKSLSDLQPGLQLESADGVTTCA